MYVCMYVYIYIQLFVYIYIHTHNAIFAAGTAARRKEASGLLIEFCKGFFINSSFSIKVGDLGGCR